MKEQFVNRLEKNQNFPPKIALLYAQMQAVRERLMRVLKKLPEPILDFTPQERTIESIGTLLLHIAAVEWSWIFLDIDKQEMDYEKWKYGFALRKDVNLPQIKGRRREFYITLLEEVRTQVFERMKQFSEEDLDILIDSDDEKYSIEWIIHHIIEHETMHIGQILLLKRLYEIKKIEVKNS